MPGGIDSHVHLAQPSAGHRHGRRFRDRHALGGGGRQHHRDAFRAAAARRVPARRAWWTTTSRGRRQVPTSTTASTSSSPIPPPSVLGQELPALVGDGYTSFKVFMTYDDLVLNDRQLLEVFDCARRERRARHGPLRGLRRHQVHDRAAGARGQDRALLPRRVAAAERRARGDPSRHLARRAGRRADHDRPRLGPRGDGADPLGAAARPQGLWRDLPAIHLAHRRRPQGPRHGRERRQVCLLAAAARPARAGTRSGRASRPACSRPSRPTIARSSTTIRRASWRRGPHLVPLGAQRHSRRRDAAADPVLRGRGRRGASRWSSSWR